MEGIRIRILERKEMEKGSLLRRATRYFYLSCHHSLRAAPRSSDGHLPARCCVLVLFFSLSIRLLVSIFVFVEADRCHPRRREPGPWRADRDGTNFYGSSGACLSRSIICHRGARERMFRSGLSESCTLRVREHSPSLKRASPFFFPFLYQVCRRWKALVSSVTPPGGSRGQRLQR